MYLESLDDLIFNSQTLFRQECTFWSTQAICVTLNDMVRYLECLGSTYIIQLRGIDLVSVGLGGISDLNRRGMEKEMEDGVRIVKYYIKELL